MEVWKPIPGYEGIYLINSIGFIKSLKFNNYNNIIYGSLNKISGYRKINLRKDNNYKMHRVHRLVLEAFLCPCPIGMEACHNNGIRDDNRIENLRWDTRKNNLADRLIHGTLNSGERCGRAKLNWEKVKLIKLLRKNFKWKISKIANLFNVTTAAIYKIINNKTWIHHF